MNLLTLESVSKQYSERLLLNHVDLMINEGERIGLIGVNGSGKSTLLRGVARQLPARAGDVVFDGEPLLALPRRALARRLAMLQQEHDTPHGLTVEQLVLHGRHPHRGLLGAPGVADLAAVDRALALVDLDHLRGRPVAELSGGQRQLAWLALALAQDTPVLLLDEPTTFLDLAHQHRLLGLVRRLATGEGITVLAVLHDLEQALRYADHLVVLDRGRVIAAGAPAETLGAELLASVFGVHARVCRAGDRPRLEISGPVEPASAPR